MMARATRNADGSYFLEVEGMPHFAASSALHLVLRLSVLRGERRITALEAADVLQQTVRELLADVTQLQGSLGEALCKVREEQEPEAAA